MALHLALAFVALSITSTGIALPSGGIIQRVQWSAQGESLLFAAGRTLGAASMCKEISDARVGAVADRVSAIVDDAATNNADVTSARATFSTGAEGGRRAVASGATSCTAVAADLAELERQLSR